MLLHCLDIPSIGLLANRSLEDICYPFLKMDLQDHNLMAQVVSLLCFGHALNTHILPPNTVPSPTDTYPIAAQFLVLYCTFVTVYSFNIIVLSLYLLPCVEDIAASPQVLQVLRPAGRQK